MKINRTLSFSLSLLSLAIFFIYGCSVGVLVNIKAQEITHPVSHTNNFYTRDGRLIKQSDYEVIKPFSYNFTKWGVSSLIEIQREADISEDLNDLINENSGDAIVELTFSVSDPPVNGLTFFTKLVSLWGSIIFIPLSIAETRADYAIIAASSAVLYLFTPAAADINVKGNVVKIVRRNDK